MKTSKCFAMDGSKMEKKPYVGFTSIVKKKEKEDSH
jgi:hypothetical protein